MAQTYNFTCDRCGFNVATEDITIPNEWGAITIEGKGHKHLCPACNMRFRVLFMANHPVPKTDPYKKEEINTGLAFDFGFGEVTNGIDE